jgi:hypothetical protein
MFRLPCGEDMGRPRLGPLVASRSRQSHQIVNGLRHTLLALTLTPDRFGIDFLKLALNLAKRSPEAASLASLDRIDETAFRAASHWRVRREALGANRYLDFCGFFLAALKRPLPIIVGQAEPRQVPDQI